MVQNVWGISWKHLELCASVMLVCHCELLSVVVCQGRVVVMEGENRGIFSPAFCTRDCGAPATREEVLSKGSTAVLLAHPCLCQGGVWSWQEAGLQQGWVSHLGGQLAHRPLAFLSEQGLLPRDAWAPEKLHLGLYYRSVSCWNGLPFKCNGLLVVLWGQRVNKIIFVCYGIA